MLTLQQWKENCRGAVCTSRQLPGALNVQKPNGGIELPVLGGGFPAGVVVGGVEVPVPTFDGVVVGWHGAGLTDTDEVVVRLLPVVVVLDVELDPGTAVLGRVLPLLTVPVLFAGGHVMLDGKVVDPAAPGVAVVPTAPGVVVVLTAPGVVVVPTAPGVVVVVLGSVLGVVVVAAPGVVVTPVVLAGEVGVVPICVLGIVGVGIVLGEVLPGVVGD